MNKKSSDHGSSSTSRNSDDTDNDISSYFFGAPGTIKSESKQQNNQKSKRKIKPNIPKPVDLKAFINYNNQSVKAPSAWLRTVQNNMNESTSTSLSSYTQNQINNEIRSMNYETRYQNTPCQFFIQGTCRYGNTCRMSHDPMHLASDEMEAAMIMAERSASKNLECGICYEVIKSVHRRFGILNACTHSFCLSCIRNWRTTTNEISNHGSNENAINAIRSCPICRIQSHFIIPSDRMITDPARKEKLIQNYQLEMKYIPCKHFNYGEGKCPFGTSCFYAHLNRDGTPVFIGEYQNRKYINSEGKIVKPKFDEINLEDFMNK